LLLAFIPKAVLRVRITNKEPTNVYPSVGASFVTDLGRLDSQKGPFANNFELEAFLGTTVEGFVKVLPASSSNSKVLLGPSFISPSFVGNFIDS
jgi:hypothetical protein